MIARFLSWIAMAIECADLLVTLRPSSRGAGTHKIFGRPGYGGGPRTKHNQLARSGAARGRPYSTLICLSAVRVPLFLLRILRFLGARIVVNQNGVYYPFWFKGNHEERNAFLAGLNAAASHSFFQSEFSVESWKRWVGPLPGSFSILPNGVDRDFFRPDHERATNASRLRCLVFLDFKESNRLLWQYFSGLVRKLDGEQWVFVGRADSPELVSQVRAALVDVPVEWVLSPAPGELAKALRSCDVSFHFVYNDVCPNKVLECLASGVFVLCSSAGGAKELVRDGGGIVLQVKEGYEVADFPVIEAVEEALVHVRAKGGSMRSEARRASEKFDLGAWTKAMTGEK
jgi:glycosyltransferase involved in cell wall biosynthesis